MVRKMLLVALRRMGRGEDVAGRLLGLYCKSPG